MRVLPGRPQRCASILRLAWQYLIGQDLHYSLLMLSMIILVEKGYFNSIPTTGLKWYYF